MQGDKVGFVFAWIFFGLGILTLGSLLQWAIARRLRGGRTQGEVIEIQMMPGVQGNDIAPHIYYRPLVRYTVDGRNYEVAGGYLIQESRTKATVRGSDLTQYETKTMPPRYQVGQPMPVAFDPDDPGRAEVVDRRREVQVILLQTFFGVLFALVGLATFWLNGNLAWLGWAR